MANLQKFFGDTVRVEQQHPKFGGKWRVYKTDDDGIFQIVGEHDEESDAVAEAESLGG